MMEKGMTFIDAKNDDKVFGFLSRKRLNYIEQAINMQLDDIFM
ncbi:TraL-like protein [Moraxella macacae 0408225]|uniref:TraL-like protein n=1 Tax=Moraxella macacae 0408225 TaxID=1230338 RepID=L2F5Z6_9GAMM|nr:TraL-like protein [Moraxella macacae 0408225]